VSLAEAFAGIAVAFSRAGLGAFYDSEARWPGVPVTDAGGSIVSPGVPVAFPCSAQVDVVTEAMRSEAGFRDKDVRLIVLAAGIGRQLDTDAVIDVQAGPSAGTYSVQSASLDPVGSHWDCRGRRA
jgi:hypothetical protein